MSSRTQGKGTGLGLSTAYGIVKQSNAFIWVYSELGKGTTFKVYFPSISEGLPETLDLPSEPPQVTQSASEPLLVVEDDELLRGLVVRLLEECEMREVAVTAIRYSVRQRREVLFKLTYRVSEGPSPDLNRWFLVSQEEQEWHHSADVSRT